MGEGIKYILIVGQEGKGSKLGKHEQDIVELFHFNIDQFEDLPIGWINNFQMKYSFSICQY